MWNHWSLALAIIALVEVHTPASSQAETADEIALKRAVDQWFVVLNAMLNGDPKPFAALYSHANDVSYMGAEGTYRIGWEATYADWQAQAKKSTGGRVEGANVHIIVSGNMACAQHHTKGQVRQPDGKMNDTLVRETSVFRKEDGECKMISHHADGLPFWEAAFHKK